MIAKPAVRKRRRVYPPEVFNEIVRLYNQGLSSREVAKVVPMSASNIAAYLKRVGLSRPRGYALTLRSVRNPFESTHWRTLRCRARKVWKRLVGPIPDGYHIHHLDGNPANNSLDNLQMLSASDHAKLHHPANPIPRGRRAARVRYQKEYMKTYVRKRRVVPAVPSLHSQPALGA